MRVDNYESRQQSDKKQTKTHIDSHQNLNQFKVDESIKENITALQHKTTKHAFCENVEYQQITIESSCSSLQICYCMLARFCYVTKFL